MNRDESIALWRQGKDAWNAWAEEMLRQKAGLEQADTWKIDHRREGKNAQSRQWIAAAMVDLSDLLMTRAFEDAARKEAGQQEGGAQPSDSKKLIVGDVIDFSGFVFPWLTLFRKVHFPKRADFNDAQFHGPTVFEGARFQGGTSFRSAQFHGQVGFTDAQFHWAADFQEARFHHAGNFENVEFHGDAVFAWAQFDLHATFTDAQFFQKADFKGAQFHKSEDPWDASADYSWEVDFRRAQFQGEVNFWRVEFHERANFCRVQFHKEADFGNALFHGEVLFGDATFKASTSFKHAAFGDRTAPIDADFTGIKVERIFYLTRASFSKVPAFNQADFAQAPDLDDVSYPFPPFFRFWVAGLESKEISEQLKADAAKYRHLRRLAILGHDHENEAKAFKGETRAKRGTEHLPWHAAFWFGVSYDALSDFGRSMMRPFYTWAVLTLLFAAFYLATSSIAGPQNASGGFLVRNLTFAKAAALGELSCVGKDPNLATISPSWETLYLAIKNGLIFMGLGSEGKIGQAHACLYGGAVAAPIYPSGLSIAQLAQNFLSGPLIFLFLLGVRNQFKIR